MGFFSKLAIALTLTACQAPTYPVAPNNAEAQAKSVFLVSTENGTGTAWVLKNEDGTGSYLLTAGHVCEDSKEFTLTSRDGVEYHAYKLAESENPDLCALYAPATVGLPLPLATNMPQYNEAMIVIGAPAGVYGEGMAPIYHVWYAGADLYTGPVFPGASGSPVISKDGVVGVLVMGRFTASLGYFVPLKAINEWLD